MQFRRDAGQERFEMRRNENFGEVRLAPGDLFGRGVQEHDVFEISHGLTSDIDLFGIAERDQNATHQYARNDSEIRP